MKNLKPNIILIGGGGHCVSVIDIIENDKNFNIKGILDLKTKNKSILNYPILGNDNLIPSLVDNNTYFLITVGHIKTSLIRKKIFNLLNKYNAKVATIVSSLAYVSKHAVVGEGSIVMNHAVVNANSFIGKNCIINTKSNIEHGVSIGDFCHISTCSVINGDTEIGSGTFIGSNATVSNGVSIKDNSVISASKFIKK